MRFVHLFLLTQWLFGCTHKWVQTQRHPGLLTADYGIVTLEDIKNNEKIARPKDRDGKPHLAWQCLVLTSYRMACESYGNNSATPTLDVASKAQRFKFYLRHVWSKEKCNEDISSWRQILSGQKVACFSGYYDSYDSKNKSLVTSWSLDKLKSNIGTWSYFEEDTN